MNITRKLNGTCPTKLTIAGNSAEEVKQEIYRLFNAGVITGMPEELENPDEEKMPEPKFRSQFGEGRVSLICKTYRKRFIGGLRAMAEMTMHQELPRPKAGDKQGRRAWDTIATVRAARMYRKNFVVCTPKQEAEEALRG